MATPLTRWKPDLALMHAYLSVLPFAVAHTEVDSVSHLVSDWDVLAAATPLTRWKPDLALVHANLSALPFAVAHTELGQTGTHTHTEVDSVSHPCDWDVHGSVMVMTPRLPTATHRPTRPTPCVVWALYATESQSMSAADFKSIFQNTPSKLVMTGLPLPLFATAT